MISLFSNKRRSRIRIHLLVILGLISGATILAQSTISNLHGDNVSLTEGGSAVLIDSGSDATVSNDGSGYNSGNLKITIASSLSSDDILINTGGAIVLSDGMTGTSTVTVSDTLIGAIAVGGTGQDGDDLIITLNASANDTLLAILIHNLSYTNSSDDPPASRTLTLTITNTDSETSTGSDITVSITSVNDAPTLTATGEDPTFTEDGPAAIPFSSTSVSSVESGQTITEIVLTVTNVLDGSDEILSIDGSDVALTDGNSLTTSANSMSGNVGLVGNTATVTISKVAGVTTTTMQTVVDSMKYRNENNTPNTSNRAITLTLIKDSGGTANGGTDTTVISIASTITVVAANDAPVLDTSASPVLASIVEELGSPVNGSIDNSVLVSSLIDSGGPLDNFYDAESNSPGIAVISVNSGTIWYSLNGGTNWTELTGVISATNSLVLFADANTRLYFEPDANVSGTVSNAIVIKAWDRTSGQINGTESVNTTTGTSFSTATDDVSITISDINDPPILTVTPNDPTFTEGDPPVDLFSGVSFSAPEAGQNIIELILRVNNVENNMDEILFIDGSEVGLGIGDSVITADHSMRVIVENRDTSNTWTYVTITDTLVTDTSTATVGFSPAVFQDVIENMTYENISTAINTSERKIVIFSAKDDGGTSNGGIDSVAYVDSTIVTLIGVNDRPELDNSKVPELNGVPVNINDPVDGETIYSTLVSAIIQKKGTLGSTIENYYDPDKDPPGIAIIGVNAQGTLWYSKNNGGNWTQLIGLVDESSSLVLTADDTTRIYYKPDNGVSGTVDEALTIKAWDRSAGGTNGTTGVNTTLGTAFSTNTDSVKIEIAAINYPPNLSATALDPTFTEGGTEVDLFSTVNAETPEPGQLLIELQITVENVLNSSDEVLLIDGSQVQLSNGNSLVTLNNSMTVNVTLFGTTATLVITKAGGVSEAVIESIIDGITYINSSNSPGNADRKVKLSSLKDDGGSSNGSDTGTYTLTSTITVHSINEPPVISNLNGDNSTIIAGGTAANIDVNGDAIVTNPDNSVNEGGRLTVIQTSGTQNGTWSFDGTIAKSGSDGVISDSEYVYVNSLIIGLIEEGNAGINGDTLVVLLSENSSNSSIGYLLKNLKYSAPTGTGNRIFSITLDDGQGNLYGGDSTATVSVTISITQNPPVVSGLNGDNIKYVKGGGAKILDVGTNASVTDPDSPDFNTGNLTVSISTGLAPAEDELVINTSGSVTLSAGMSIGSNVSISAVEIGTIQSTGSGTDLVITFNSNSTHARVNVLLQSVAYNNTNATSPSLVTRVIDFTIQDGAGVGFAMSNISSVQVVLNSTPTTTGISDVAVNSNAPNTVIDLSLSFNDVDEASTALMYTVGNISNPELFTSVFISGYFLVLDYGLSTNGISTIIIRATDSGSAFAETSFNVKVGESASTQNTPAVTINTGANISEGGSLSITSSMISAQNIDGSSSTLIYHVIKSPIHGSLVKSANLLKASSIESFSFTQSDLESGSIKYIHNGSEVEHDYFGFIVVNENDISSSENNFLITIIPTNDAPVISELKALRMNEDEIYTLNVTEWYPEIADPETPDSLLTISLTCADENITLTRNDNFIYTISTAEDYYGTAELEVTVSDGELSSKTNVDLIVNPVNDLPTIFGLPELVNIRSGEIGALNLMDHFSDKETPDSLLRLSFSVSPDSLLFDYKHQSCRLTYFVYGAFTGEAVLKITVTDEQGGSSHGEVIIRVSESQVSDISKINGLPEEFVLFQNYPNPFNPVTIIRYGIPEVQNVSVIIYDILGNKVTTLLNTLQSPGFYELRWDASHLASGIYIYVFNAGDFREVKKMNLTK